MPEISLTSQAVFLSYAREDAEAARRIAEALRGFGVEVWFDQNELRGGDQWDQKIRGQIKACALFIPVISATTQTRDEAYFRLEWKLADDRSHLMATGKTFIVPVVIDDTPESGVAAPESFTRAQWTRLPAGVPTPKFVEQVRKLLSKEPVVGASLVDARESDGRRHATPLPKKSSLSVWIWGAITAISVGIVAALMVGRKAETSAPKPAVVTQPPIATAPAVAPDDKSIAVLPFTNMSEDKDSSFFSDGVHEDILTNLANIRDLRVVSRTSVMPYRTTTKSMPEIAKELGVAYILEGSVRRAGNKVRVTGQLIHAATDEHVWAKSYDRDITDIFTIQAELASQIAVALQTVLSPKEQKLIARRPTSNAEAYDLYLQARELRNRGGSTIETRKRQIELLERAVTLDPAFALAWGELSANYAFGYFTNDQGMENLLSQAKGAIERAVQLAPDDPEIISTQGYYYYYAFRDYARANDFYEELARLQPNAPVVFNSLGLIQRRQGRWVESLANTRRASELDPSNISFLRNLLATLTAARRWDEVLATQRRIVALLPDDLDEVGALGYYHFAATGSTAEGDAFLAKLSPEQFNSPQMVNTRQAWAAAKGDLVEAIRLDRLQPYYDGNGTPHWRQATVQAGRLFAAGDRAGALARLGEFPRELRALLAKEPKNLAYMSTLADMEAILGHKEEALRLAERYVALMPESKDALDGASYASARASVYDVVGETEKALAEYTRLFRTPCVNGPNIHIMQRDRSSQLWDDPRYQALIHDPKNNAPLF